MEMLEDYIISMKSNAKDVGDFSENDLCCKFKNNLIFIWKHGFNMIIQILAFQKSEIAKKSHF
jgi:hypothetical protein